MATPNSTHDRQPPGESVRVYDPERPCPKCASEDVTTTFQADSHELACHAHRVPQPYDLDNRLTCSGCGDEHFDRTCRRCHFVWREEVAA